MELFTLFFALAYTALFLLFAHFIMGTIAGWRTFLRGGVRKCVAVILIVICASLLAVAVLHGDPIKGIGVISLSLITVLIVLIFLMPVLCNATKLSNITMILIIPSVLLFTGFATYLVISVQLTINDFVSYLLGTILIGAILAGLVLSVCLIRLGNPYTSITFTLVVLWILLGIIGLVYFETENNGLDEFVGMKATIAQKEIEKAWYDDPYYGTYRWRITSVEFTNFSAYRARLEAYSWMRIPIYVLHIHMNSNGERQARLEETWWEKWLP